MQWEDSAIVIGLRHHGESAVIVDLLTAERGRHMGFVHGGRSRRLRPVLQAGNSVRVNWQARQEGSLGTVALEPLRLRAAQMMESRASLHALNLVCALASLLPEREPQPMLAAMVETILDRLDGSDSPAAALVRLELAFLRELGFGLDLARCAVTGSSEDLAYVSPKTGRAVCRSAGEPYRDRVFALPRFLQCDDQDVTSTHDDLIAGFALTRHFLLRDVFAPRGLPMPACRDALVSALPEPQRPLQSDRDVSQTVLTTWRAIP